jgi:hypothetical protein
LDGRGVLRVMGVTQQVACRSLKKICKITS